MTRQDITMSQCNDYVHGMTPRTHLRDGSHLETPLDGCPFGLDQIHEIHKMIMDIILNYSAYSNNLIVEGGGGLLGYGLLDFCAGSGFLCFSHFSYIHQGPYVRTVLVSGYKLVLINRKSSKSLPETLKKPLYSNIWPASEAV